ncbi:MAG: NUDIX hydrolase [Planctomycetaceae bacterium]|nr:NUDIX hydrolase [Planctomycetaceae bacterium]MBL4886542.1 NUDIX hydrolase [Planctomycetaceae bacterium]
MSHLNPPECFCNKIPPGDDRERLVCTGCGWVHYENPKIIVGAVVAMEDKILLCKRAIEPRIGYWTIPAGFMELGETADQGATREAWEEAHAKIKTDALLAVYSIPRANQVHLIYRAELLDANFSPGIESQQVRLYDWKDIPWQDLAFISNRWALQQYDQSRALKSFPAFSVPTEDIETVSQKPL